jgi:hypothetical protein
LGRVTLSTTLCIDGGLKVSQLLNEQKPILRFGYFPKHSDGRNNGPRISACRTPKALDELRRTAERNIWTAGSPFQMDSHFRAFLIREQNAMSMKRHLSADPKLRTDTTRSDFGKLTERNDAVSFTARALVAHDRDRAHLQTCQQQRDDNSLHAAQRRA